MVPRPSGDDRDAIDRAFAEMIAGYHLTAEPPVRLDTEDEEPEQSRPPESHALDLDSRWADQHPLFAYVEPAPSPQPVVSDEDDTFDPGPPPPWPRPSAALVVGWVGVAYAVIAMIAAALGAPVPRWAGWLAVGSFVAGFALLLSRLPRNRPPDAGDGAVL